MKLHTIHTETFDYLAPETACRFVALARDIAQYGENPAYLVGAVAFGIDQHDQSFFIPTANTIPDAIKNTLTDLQTIGGGHPSVHAEMHAMECLPPFKRVSFAISRPPCPTCLEGISELRNFHSAHGTVDSLFIDSHSLNDPSTQDKWDISKKMVENIAENGHIGVTFLNLETRIWEVFTPRALDTLHAETENPLFFKYHSRAKALEDFNLAYLLAHTIEMATHSTIPDNQEAATALGRTHDGEWVTISASASLPPGFTVQQHNALLAQDSSRTKRSYQYKMSAAKRVMIAAIKEGILLENGILVCSTPPQSGMLVNAIDYGLRTFITPPMTFSPQSPDHMAFLQLQQAGILNHRIVKPKKTDRSLPVDQSDTLLEWNYEF